MPHPPGRRNHIPWRCQLGMPHRATLPTADTKESANTAHTQSLVRLDPPAFAGIGPTDHTGCRPNGSRGPTWDNVWHKHSPSTVSAPVACVTFAECQQAWHSCTQMGWPPLLQDAYPSSSVQGPGGQHNCHDCASDAFQRTNWLLQRLWLDIDCDVEVGRG